MVVIMVVIMVVVVIIMVVITLSLIRGTGIRLVNTTTTEKHPILWPITGPVVTMALDPQTGQETRLVPLIALPREHPIFHPEAHLTEPPQEPPTVHLQERLIVHPQERPTVHPQELLITHLQQTFPQEDQVVPGAVEVIAEVVVGREVEVVEVEDDN